MACEAGNCRCEDVSSGHGHPGGLPQCEESAGAVVEVVERTEQQRSVEGVVVELQPAGVADLRGEGVVALGGGDLRFDRVDENDVVSGRG